MKSWPKWFPYPGAWLETVILTLLTTPLISSLRVFGRIGLVSAYSSNNLGPMFLFVTLGYVLPYVAFAYVHSFLYGNRPAGWSRSLPAPRSIFEAFYALSVTTIGLLLTLTAVMFVIDPQADEQSEVVSWIAGICWWVSVLYLCQVKRSVWDGINAERKVKTQPTKVKANPFDVDLELEQLKGNMGVNSVKKRKGKNLM